MLGNRSRTNQVMASTLSDVAENIHAVDFDIFSDSFKLDEYSYCLANVGKLWLMSHQYDRVRYPDWAGFFDHLLREYPMSDTGALQVQQALLKAANNKVDNLLFVEATAEPLLKKEQWNIGVEVVDKTSGLSTKTLAKNEKVFTTIDASDNVSYTSVSE